MKKILTICLLLVSVTTFAEEKRTTFSVSSGIEYLDNTFFNFGVSVIKPLGQNKELDFKVALNMKTEENNEGETEPLFNVPFKLGINFLFPAQEKLTFLVGTGITPMLRLAGEDKGLLIGPNVKAGVRYKVHPTMNIFLEACESLLIGPPKWNYLSTEVVFGVNFYL